MASPSLGTLPSNVEIVDFAGMAKNRHGRPSPSSNQETQNDAEVGRRLSSLEATLLTQERRLASIEKKQSALETSTARMETILGNQAKTLRSFITVAIGALGGFALWFFTGFYPSTIKDIKDLDTKIQLVQKDTGDIKDILKNSLSYDLKKAALTTGQGLNQSLETINNIVRLAQDKKLVLDREATAEAGKALFNQGITADAQDVWDTAIRLVVYQTFVGGQLRPLARPRDVKREAFEVEPGAEGKYMLQGVWLEEATQTLDGIIWEGGVFNKCHIRYNGGFLRLNNVRFIDCTFDIEKTPKGARFGEAVLSSISASVDLAAKT